MDEEIPTPPPTDVAASHKLQGEPPADAGEPQGARDDRPEMLGRSFVRTLLTGAIVGLILALGAHLLITNTVWDSSNATGWSWALAALGGLAVGGACTLFIYGAATDRDDATEETERGQADVSQRGEWRRTLDRRRRRRGQSM